MSETQDTTRKPQVLVADDEAHILHILSMKLTNAGYEVTTAVDGEEALELALAEKPDLIITDFQMPCLTGLQLCKRLRENEQTSQIPVLMLTARGFDIEEDEMAAAGIRSLLSKPFSPRQVLSKVQQLIGDGGPKRDESCSESSISASPDRAADGQEEACLSDGRQTGARESL